MTEIANIWNFNLCRGSTDHPRNGACLYDAANWIIYGTVGDDPPSACPVIRSFAFRLNDLLPDDERQRLKLFILRVIDNRDPASEPDRAKFLVQRVANVIVPMARKAAGRTKNADDEVVAFANTAAAQIADAKATLAQAAIGAADWHVVADYVANAVEAAAKAVSNSRTRNRVHNAAIETLDGVLKIGRQADPFDEKAVRLAVATFERAHWEDEPVGIA